MEANPLTGELNMLKDQLASLVKEKKDHEDALAKRQKKDAFKSEILAAVAAVQSQTGPASTQSPTDPLYSQPLNP